MATNGLFQAHLDTDKAEQVENFRKENKLSKSDITDHDRYILNHKLDAIRNIRV